MKSRGIGTDDNVRKKEKPDCGHFVAKQKPGGIMISLYFLFVPYQTTMPNSPFSRDSHRL